jgi:hypothetical protein
MGPNTERQIELINGNPVTTVVKTIVTARELKNTTFMVLSEDVEYKGKIMPRGEKIIRRLIENAEEGSQSAISEILDRTMGKPLQQNVNLNSELSYDDFLDMLGVKGDSSQQENKDNNIVPSSFSPNMDSPPSPTQGKQNSPPIVDKMVNKFLRIEDED